MSTAKKAAPALPLYATLNDTHPDAIADYEALHAAAVAAGMISADQRPSKLGLSKGVWTVQA